MNPLSLEDNGNRCRIRAVRMPCAATPRATCPLGSAPSSPTSWHSLHKSECCLYVAAASATAAAGVVSRVSHHVPSQRRSCTSGWRNLPVGQLKMRYHNPRRPLPLARDSHAPSNNSPGDPKRGVTDGWSCDGADVRQCPDATGPALLLGWLPARPSSRRDDQCTPVADDLKHGGSIPRYLGR